MQGTTRTRFRFQMAQPDGLERVVGMSGDLVVSCNLMGCCQSLIDTNPSEHTTRMTCGSTLAASASLSGGFRRCRSRRALRQHTRTVPSIFMLRISARAALAGGIRRPPKEGGCTAPHVAREIWQAGPEYPSPLPRGTRGSGPTWPRQRGPVPVVTGDPRVQHTEKS